MRLIYHIQRIEKYVQFYQGSKKEITSDEEYSDEGKSGKRELERQIDSGYYERYMLSQKPLTPAIEGSKRATGNVFLDNYVLDFFDVPETVSERDLQE